MIALLKKEIQGFLSSLIGYIAVVVFLVLTGLLLWVFPSNYNVLNGIDASLQSFFDIAPWVFIILVPAITMRSFAEEKRTGTIELLYTKPISDLSIILSKYGAAIAIILISLIPTLAYVYTINQLSSPIGNIDSGAIIGAYLGLLFLAVTYTSIGIFASAITNNQVVAFILSVFLCFFIYGGFDSIGGLELFQGFELYIYRLGILEHYKAISRGILDSRDFLYFISANIIFIGLTKFFMESRKW